MIIEQAVFGIKSGRGHGLITSTIDERLLQSVRTDFLSTINPHSDWQPYFKTQIIDNYFLFLKTFPDNDQSRKGSVFTHALIFKKADIHLLENLNDVFSLFRDKNEISLPLEGIELQPTTFQKFENSLINKVVHCLVQPNFKNKPIVWLDKQEFLPMITELWAAIPKYTRQTFTFRYSIKPEDLTNDKYYILYSNQANHWSEYDIVIKQDSHQPSTAAELFILNRSAENDISNFLTKLELEVYDFSKLQTIQRAAENYKSLEDLNFRNTFALLQRILTIVPMTSQGKSIKEKVLSRLLKLTPDADVEELTQLGNLKIGSIANAQERIENAIRTRFQKELESKSIINSFVELLKTFFLNVKRYGSHWWYQLIEIEVSSFFKRDSSQSSKTIWELWEKDLQFINWLKPYLLNQSTTEHAIAQNTPITLSEKLGKSLKKFTQERKWLLLHAHAVTAYTTISEAFKLQFDIDKNLKHNKGFNVIAQKANSIEIIDAALKFEDKRLLFLAGQACNQNSSLFEKIELENPIWQQIWLEKIEINSSYNVWDGFRNSTKTLYEILNTLLSNQKFDDKLLLKISQSNVSNLLDYPRRKDIWKILPFDAKANFLESTAKNWYKQLSISNIHKDLEPPLRQAVSKTEYVYDFISSTNSFQLILELFKRFERFDENLLCQVINKRIGYKSIENTEAILLGEIVNSRNWYDAQEIIIDKFSRNNNLGLALQKFEHRLSFWNGLKLWRKGYSNRNISSSDWWKEFQVLVSKNLYKKGVRDNGIWERAGGDIDFIPLDSSSIEQWNVALSRLRYGGGGKEITVNRLFKEIEKEYYGNEKLRILKETYKHIK